MIKCNQCGRENEDHYKFCLGCGAPLAAQQAAAPAAEAAGWPANCPSCGAEVVVGQRFCGTCGYNVADHVVKHSGSQPAVSQPSAPAPAPAAAAAPAAPQQAPGSPTSGGAAVQPAAQASGQPSAAAPAYVVFVQPDGSPGEAFGLQMGENLIGRSVAFTTFQSDQYLSMQHAKLVLEPQGAQITDMGTPNGVFLRMNASTALQHGDEIRIGQERLRFELLDQLPPLTPAPGDGTKIIGSPRGGAWARLCRLSAHNESSIVFLLRQDEHRLGREQGDILFPDDGYVSGRHARIYREGGQAFVEDLGSSNGTFLRIRETTPLPPNALVLLGEKPYRFVRPS
ncbi:MAG: FHA domain-containing protein [Deltaproteobacteria bacterium]|nr:MAG: FHA domain-containing protein [Deltaproteobacteria bacterium]